MRNRVDTESSVGVVGIASGLKNQAKKIVPIRSTTTTPFTQLVDFRIV